MGDSRPREILAKGVKEKEEKERIKRPISSPIFPIAHSSSQYRIRRRRRGGKLER